MPTFTSDYVRNNQSFSGCDMVATISVPLTDNTVSHHVLGALQTVTYSIHMDKHPVRSVGSVNAKDYTYGPRTIAGTLIFAVFHRHVAYEVLEAVKSNHNLENYHLLMDELPPFDITISFANEYGTQARLAIYGVRIINEGQTMSINDVYTENTYQFVATDIEYMNGSNTVVSAREFEKEIAKASTSGTRVRVHRPIPSSGAERVPTRYGVVIQNGTISIERR